MEVQNTAIRYWAEDDRPREKMMLKGKNALSDAELIAILIGTGTGSKSAVDLGRELLALSNGNLNNFAKLRLAQLCTIKGIGESKAISILAALELGRRRKSYDSGKLVRITESKQVFDLIRGYFEDLLHEEFYVLYLNKRNQVLQIKQLSVGGLTGTFVDAKIIFKVGIDCSASALILAHNHPSGQLRPSMSDEKLTKQIKHFGEMIEMPILDHLIITDNGYFSFSDKKLL
jgi:DNA repair protein RadC